MSFFSRLVLGSLLLAIVSTGCGAAAAGNRPADTSAVVSSSPVRR